MGKDPTEMQDKELYQQILGLTHSMDCLRGQFKTILVGRVPRVKCPEHGVKSVAVPWAEPHNRFTIMFERFAIEVLQMTQTVKGAMTILRLLWDATSITAPSKRSTKEVPW